LIKFDKNYRNLIDAVIYMVDGDKSGTIEINYNKGKVNYLYKKENMTALSK